MYIPKKYGKSRIDECPFCGKPGTTKNMQEIPVCSSHKNNELKDLKCVCGKWMDLRTGKWGPYFNCINCGNINFKKGLEMNKGIMHIKEIKNTEKIKKEEAQNEITISSEEVDFI